jgi:hypothetical protein
MDLAPVVGAIARDLGLSAILRVGGDATIPGTRLRSNRAMVAVLARRPEDLSPLSSQPDWHRLLAAPGLRAWTDHYSNIVQALRFEWTLSDEPH